jgi:hypothetical protein
MGTVDVLIVVVTAGAVALGIDAVVLLVRSRRDPDVIRWGRRHLFAPRLYAFGLLLFSLLLASRLLSHLLFAQQSTGFAVMLAVSGALLAACLAVYGLRFHRLNKIARSSAPRE